MEPSINSATPTPAPTSTTQDLGSLIEAASDRQDLPRHRRAYVDQGEFVVVEDFLPVTVLQHWNEELDQLKPHVHRTFIPRYKQGGSAAYPIVRQLAPTIAGVYHAPRFIDFLRQIVDAPLGECPDSDPHRCALYSYTEEGDHIGWHYDTSYYKDRRWTVLVGLQDQSSSKLLCQLHKRSRDRDVVNLELKVKPGTLVIFNGDKLWHCVTPIRANEFRYIVSMQYVTNSDMNPFMRFISNMKDAIAYFGFRRAFARTPRSATGNPA
jgi:hypothetical protein